MKHLILYGLLALLILFISCINEDPYYYATGFQAPEKINYIGVPDSCRYDSISVFLSALLGTTTAYSFEAIIADTTETDDSSVYVIILTRLIVDTRKVFETRDINFDSLYILKLTPADTGLLYLKTFNYLREMSYDSTYIYK